MLRGPLWICNSGSPLLPRSVLNLLPVPVGSVALLLLHLVLGGCRKAPRENPGGSPGVTVRDGDPRAVSWWWGARIEVMCSRACLKGQGKGVRGAAVAAWRGTGQPGLGPELCHGMLCLPWALGEGRTPV